MENFSSCEILLPASTPQGFLDTMTSYDESWLSPCSSFPQKLFALSLREFDQGECVEWCAMGSAFRVKDTEVFAEDILPKYFKRMYTVLSFFCLISTFSSNRMFLSVVSTFLPIQIRKLPAFNDN